jgi:hypothetical protein
VVLLVEETGITDKYPRSVASDRKTLSHTIILNFTICFPLYDITEILLKVALNTLTLTLNIPGGSTLPVVIAAYCNILCRGNINHPMK